MIDEMDASLHPDLMEYILKNYLLEYSESQLLITTHYDGLLTKIDDLIRKDNVWFTEKDRSGVTHLYSLVEFKGLNKIKHIDKASVSKTIIHVPPSDKCLITWSPDN